MQTLITVFRVIRNIYIVVMMIPLWLITAYYRYAPEIVSAPRSLDLPWQLSVIVFLYGVAVVSYYIDDLEVKRRHGATIRGTIVRLVILFTFLLITTFGSVLIGKHIAIGQPFFWFGTAVLPVCVLYLFASDSGSRKEKPDQENR